MKKLLILFSFVFLFTQFSCDPDPVLEDTTNVELIFKGKFDSETFMINSVYDFNGSPLRFDQFNFFISNVVLIKDIVGNPEETEVLEIDFVELSIKPVDMADAEKGFTITASNIPVGDYSAIKLGIGVPPDLNKTNWDDYGSGHPLRRSLHYWLAWESFIFSKTEAKIDIDNDNSFTHKLSYHTGADEAFRTSFFAKELKLEKGTNTQITFEVDAKKMFEGIDVLNQTGTHNLGDLDLVNKVMDNLQGEAISIQ